MKQATKEAARNLNTIPFTGFQVLYTLHQSQTFARELSFVTGSMKIQLPTPLTLQLSTSQLIITSTMALGSSSARKSCSMASMMFFQPSRRMSPWRWAKWNTVFAAIWALGLLPKTVGRFSIDCRKEEAVAISQKEMFSFQQKLGQMLQNFIYGKYNNSLHDAWITPQLTFTLHKKKYKVAYYVIQAESLDS